MALTSTITAWAWEPFSGNVATDFTLARVDILATQGSGATSGGLELIADPSVSNNFFLNSLMISRADATGGSYMDVYVGQTKVATLATMGAATTDFTPINFGEPGFLGEETTTTASVSLIIAGGTCTVNYAVLGKRKRS